MAPTEPAPWWARPTMLSLDGPAFVVLARAAVGRPVSSRFADTLLACALVWAGYLLDRWLDARYDGEVRTWRHGFAGRLGPVFMVIAVLVGLGAVLGGARVPSTWAEAPGGSAPWLPLGLAAIFGGRWLRIGWTGRAWCVVWLLVALAGWGEAWSPTSQAAIALLAFANLLAIRRAEQPTERGPRGWLAATAVGATVVAWMAPGALTIGAAAGVGVLMLLGGGGGRHAERRRAIVDAVTFLALAAAASAV